MNLVDYPDGFSIDNLNQSSWPCSIEVIARGLSFRRMISAVKHLGEATELIRSVFLRRDIPKYLARNPLLTGQRKEDTKTTLRLNPGQEKAVMCAVTSPFTLIQGPPGKHTSKKVGAREGTRPATSFMQLVHSCEQPKSSRNDQNVVLAACQTNSNLVLTRGTCPFKLWLSPRVNWSRDLSQGLVPSVVFSDLKSPHYLLS